METFTRLGFPLTVHKLEGPTTPREKLQELQHLIRQWVVRKSCTQKDPTGKLGHAAIVVQPGKTCIGTSYSGTHSSIHGSMILLDHPVPFGWMHLAASDVEPGNCYQNAEYRWSGQMRQDTDGCK